MNLKAIGSRIKTAREKKGLTQEALSEIVDLSPMHMSVTVHKAKGIICAFTDARIGKILARYIRRYYLRKYPTDKLLRSLNTKSNR